MNAPDTSDRFAQALAPTRDPLAPTRDPFPASRGCEIRIAIRPAA